MENVTGNNKVESGLKLARHSSLGKYLEEMMVERREEEIHYTSRGFWDKKLVIWSCLLNDLVNT